VANIPGFAVGHREQLSDPAKIAKWAAAFPGCNWAVRTRIKSFVVDVDVKFVERKYQYDGRHLKFPSINENGLATLDHLESKHRSKIAETVSASTGRDNGSLHLFFKKPVGYVKCRVKSVPGIDVRGSSG
jgi:hypothetical protein